MSRRVQEAGRGWLIEYVCAPRPMNSLVGDCFKELWRAAFWMLGTIAGRIWHVFWSSVGKAFKGLEVNTVTIKPGNNIGKTVPYRILF